MLLLLPAIFVIANTLSLEDVQSRLMRFSPADQIDRKKLQYASLTYKNMGPLPKDFDATKKWEHCNSLQNVRDQASCASCWAVTPASVASDRLCIHREINTFLSATELISCCADCAEDACKAGAPFRAFQYWKDHGLVTGGEYGSNYGCKPYFLGPSTSPDAIKTPACTAECPSFCNPVRYYGSDVLRIRSDQIEREILNNGPVAAVFNVDRNLANYTSGIFEGDPNNYLDGLHVAKIYGWGETSDGTKFWRVANSWGKHWGENGNFRIIRGEDNSGIEGTEVLAAMPF